MNEHNSHQSLSVGIFGARRFDGDTVFFSYASWLPQNSDPRWPLDCAHQVLADRRFFQCILNPRAKESTPSSSRPSFFVAVLVLAILPELGIIK